MKKRTVSTARRAIDWAFARVVATAMTYPPRDGWLTIFFTTSSTFAYKWRRFTPGMALAFAMPRIFRMVPAPCGKKKR